MENKEIIKRISEYFKNKGLKIDTDQRKEDGKICYQIDIDFNENGSFAFFWKQDEKIIYYSSIYQLKESMSKEYKNELKEKIINDGTFIDVLLLDDNDKELHLYGEINRSEINDEFFNKINNFYFKDKELVNLINSLSY